MAEHALSFQDWGIRAILAAAKTVTRRLGPKYARWKPGSTIWCRETHHEFNDGDCFYRADYPVGTIPVHATTRATGDGSPPGSCHASCAGTSLPL